jgi:hypothetical protein
MIIYNLTFEPWVWDNMGPGYSVDLVLNMDLLKETIDVRKSLIYDVEGNQYILSQTSPSIKKYDIGKSIHITHLKRQGDQYVRHGFLGRLVESIKDYQLHSSQLVEGLRVRRLSNLDTYDLRMYYRLRPGAAWPFRFEIASQPATLLDVSLGGASFSLNSKSHYEPAQTIDVICSKADGERHSILVKIKRVWSPANLAKTDVKYVAVQFLRKDINLNKDLEREILQIQRGAIYKT